MKPASDLPSLLNSLTPDPEKNIYQILKHALLSIKAACSFYNRFDDRKHLFYKCACEGLEEDFQLKGRPEGRVCFERNGLSSREVAKQLNLSEETVKTHRRNIRKKLNLHNTNVSLAAYLRSKWEA